MGVNVTTAVQCVPSGLVLLVCLVYPLTLVALSLPLGGESVATDGVPVNVFG